MILDHGRPARGKGGGSNEVFAQGSRKLGRNQWQEESSGIQIEIFRKEAGNSSHSKYQFSYQ